MDNAETIERLLPGLIHFLRQLCETGTSIRYCQRKELLKYVSIIDSWEPPKLPPRPLDLPTKEQQNEDSIDIYDPVNEDEDNDDYYDDPDSPDNITRDNCEDSDDEETFEQVGPQTKYITSTPACDLPNSSHQGFLQYKQLLGRQKCYCVLLVTQTSGNIELGQIHKFKGKESEQCIDVYDLQSCSVFYFGKGGQHGFKIVRDGQEQTFFASKSEVTDWISALFPYCKSCTDPKEVSNQQENESLTINGGETKGNFFDTLKGKRNKKKKASLGDIKFDDLGPSITVADYLDVAYDGKKSFNRRWCIVNSMSGQLTCFVDRSSSDFERSIPLAADLDFKDFKKDKKKHIVFTLVNKHTKKDVISLLFSNSLMHGNWLAALTKEMNLSTTGDNGKSYNGTEMSSPELNVSGFASECINQFDQRCVDSDIPLEVAPRPPQGSVSVIDTVEEEYIEVSGSEGMGPNNNYMYSLDEGTNYENNTIEGSDDEIAEYVDLQSDVTLNLGRPVGESTTDTKEKDVRTAKSKIMGFFKKKPKNEKTSDNIYMNSTSDTEDTSIDELYMEMDVDSIGPDPDVAKAKQRRLPPIPPDASNIEQMPTENYENVYTDSDEADDIEDNIYDDICQDILKPTIAVKPTQKIKNAISEKQERLKAAVASPKNSAQLIEERETLDKLDTQNSSLPNSSSKRFGDNTGIKPVISSNIKNITCALVNKNEVKTEIKDLNKKTVNNIPSSSTEGSSSMNKTGDQSSVPKRNNIKCGDDSNSEGESDDFYEEPIDAPIHTGKVKCHEGPTIETDKNILENSKNPILDQIRKTRRSSSPMSVGNSPRSSFRSSSRSSDGYNEKGDIEQDIKTLKHQLSDLRKKSMETRSAKLSCDSISERTRHENLLKQYTKERVDLEDKLAELTIKKEELVSLSSSSNLSPLRSSRYSNGVKRTASDGQRYSSRSSGGSTGVTSSPTSSTSHINSTGVCRSTSSGSSKLSDSTDRTVKVSKMSQFWENRTNP